MSRGITLTHEFVDYLPDELKEGMIYVSMAFATVAHKCCCGCGNEVTTPLSPTDWKLVFDGESISLEPSIGNWNFPCRSHYWIRHSRVKWAAQWSEEEVAAGRAQDALAKETHFGSSKPPTVQDVGVGGRGQGKSKESLWQKLKKWLFSIGKS